MKVATAVYILGSVLTLVVAFALARAHKPALAGAIIIASPFPCPPGLPC